MLEDKALVWSTDGGKNRRLIGGADAFAEDSMEGFRAAAKALTRQGSGLRSQNDASGAGTAGDASEAVRRMR